MRGTRPPCVEARRGAGLGWPGARGRRQRPERTRGRDDMRAGGPRSGTPIVARAGCAAAAAASRPQPGLTSSPMSYTTAQGRQQVLDALAAAADQIGAALAYLGEAYEQLDDYAAERLE